MTGGTSRYDAVIFFCCFRALGWMVGISLDFDGYMAGAGTENSRTPPVVLFPDVREE